MEAINRRHQPKESRRPEAPTLILRSSWSTTIQPLRECAVYKGRRYHGTHGQAHRLPLRKTSTLMRIEKTRGEAPAQYGVQDNDHHHTFQASQVHRKRTMDITTTSIQ